MKIDYKYFEDTYDDLPTREYIRRSTEPVGSFTDNARKIKPNRDGAHKRVRIYEEKEY
jgi:hypothetical protein